MASYNHKCRKDEVWGDYVISWTVDRQLGGTRLRRSVVYKRDVEEFAARRFCAKWDIVFPAIGGGK